MKIKSGASPTSPLRSNYKEFPHIGPVLFQHNPRSRRLKIILRPLQAVKVSIPEDVSLALAEAFVKEKEEWIRRQLPAIREKEAQQTLFLPDTPFETRRHRLIIKQEERRKPYSRLTDTAITCYLPRELSLEGPEAQNWIRRALERTWREEAREILPEWVQQEADRWHISYKDVRIKNTRARWGSCSPSGRINLSLHLMRLPDSLIGYVILHELIHREVPHHGPDFWNRLEEVCPGARSRHRELKGWNPRFY